jgi:hypothetical protein
MGITVLPDWGKELGRSLGEAGKGISEIIDPLVDFHTKFAEEAAANPEMVEKLAGHAFVNEGDLGPAAKFIPKKILADIKDRASKGLVPPEFFKRKAGIDVSRMKRASTAGEVTPEEIASLKPYGGFSNQEWYDMGKSAIVGESVAGTAHGLAGAPYAPSLAKSGAGAEIAKNNLAIVMDKLHGDQLQTYIQYRAGLDETNRQILDNLDVDEAVRFQARIKADKDMMESRNAVELKRQSELMDERMGYWMAEHNGGGNPKDWQEWMGNNKLREKVKNDAASGQMDEEDNRFAEVNRLYQARDARINSLEMSRLNNLISSAQERILGNPKKGIKPDDETLRGARLTRLNVDLAHYAAATNTKPIQAFYGNLYQIKSKPIGEPEEREKLEKTLPYQEVHRKMAAQERAKQNTLHYVVSPRTKDAQEVDPKDVSDMVETSTSSASQAVPQTPQPSGTSVVSPPKPATSEDVINAARSRYIVVRDSLTKSGVPLNEAQKRAAAVTESIFNLKLRQ